MTMRLLLLMLACLGLSTTLVHAQATSTPIPTTGGAGSCPDGTGPQFIGKPYEPTTQGSYCDVRGGGARPHKGVDMMQREGYLAPIPQGCKIMMNGQSPIWCQGKPQGVGGYGYYMRFACGRRTHEGKEYKVEVRYAHIKGYDASSQKAIVSCTGCVGITPHVHYEVVVEGRKVNPVCVWGTGISRNVNCPSGLDKPANLCDGRQLKILHEQACHCPNFGCGGPGATTSMKYDNGVDPSTLTGSYSSPGGATCPAQMPAGTPHNPGSVPSGGEGGPDSGQGQGDPNPGYQENEEGCSMCCCPCTQPIIEDQKRIRRHVDVFGNPSEQSEFEEHRNWMVYTFFQEHILRAMMMMTSQLTTVGVEQIRIIGTFLDAKHQLETQRLFQRLSVRAHKDYQPSEGLCEFGTVARSLLASERRSDLAKMAIAQQSLKRTVASGDILSVQGGASDKASRLKTFISKHCDINDNAKGLNNLCQKSAPKNNRNRDVDFVGTIESKLTLEIDMSKVGAKGASLMDGSEDATRFAAAEPEAGSNLVRYIHKARSDDELLRLSGSRWVPAIVADRAGRNPALMLAGGTALPTQFPDPKNDKETIPYGATVASANALTNDEYDLYKSRITKIRFGNQSKDVPETGSVMIDGAYGHLTIRASGSFTYTLEDQHAIKDKETFVYTLSTPPLGGADANIVIEFGLPNDTGSGGGSGGGNGTGTGGTGSGSGSGSGGGNESGEGEDGSTGSGTDTTQGISDDYENVTGLFSNLIASDVLPQRPDIFYANDKGEIRPDAVPLYLDMRAVVAKRSVAVNSLASIIGQRISGEPESAPFLKRMIAELGVPENEVEFILGKNPSYFAQMEVLTKKAYENPVFYTELYDKPANVARKAAALKAIGLMQDRDIYQSLLRSEMVGSVLLETLLMEKQEALENVINPSGGSQQRVITGGQ